MKYFHGVITKDVEIPSLGVDAIENSTSGWWERT